MCNEEKILISEERILIVEEDHANPWTRYMANNFHSNE